MKNTIRIVRILFILTLLILSDGINAQSINTMFTLGVVMPQPSNDFSQEQITKLETKIVQIINNSEGMTVDYTNDFVVYPVISIEESSVVDGGMQNITVTSIEVSLFVKQVSKNFIFSTVSKKIKGSGTNKPKSTSNAINQINVNDKLFVQFLLDAKTKILKYYNENCSSILNSANKLSKQQDYEQSISMLQSVPIACSSCYIKAQENSLEVYKKYQTLLCTKNITKAKNAITLHNYDDAFQSLEIIDPSSTCYPEVKKLIAEISSKVERKEKQELDLEKQRINAEREIAKAYYSRTVKLVNYNILVL